MNSAAICNKDCLEVRNNETLDQQRTGTIIWTVSELTASLFEKLEETQHKFTGNMTHLNINGLERSMEEHNLRHWSNRNEWSLEEVTSLTFSTTAATQSSLFICLANLLPNLEELHLTSMKGPATAIIEIFGERCPHLSKFTWNGNSIPFWYCGDEFNKCSNLTHLYLDGSFFIRFFQEGNRAFGVHERPNSYLFMKCKRLECLSLKGATFYDRNIQHRSLPQDDLIKMVRIRPTLRWLRSDLSADNVAMLKAERPEITFVSK